MAQAAVKATEAPIERKITTIPSTAVKVQDAGQVYKTVFVRLPAGLIFWT
jgi:hypothetical protein